MIQITAIDGQVLDVDETKIVLVAGPYPHDPDPRTYVHGVTAGAIKTAESAQALVARLPLNPPLAMLTRPDLTPVWIKGNAVSAIRAPLLEEEQGPGEVQAVVMMGARRQTVHEDVASATTIIRAHGGNV